jgi:uncharacterized protein (DUF1697 family)
MEAEILRAYGTRVPVIVLTVSEMMDITLHNPLIKSHKDEAKLHITFLSETPRQENSAQLMLVTNPPDEFILRDKSIYLFCPNGYGRTKFTNNFFEQKLKVTATTRNWKTAHKLIELANQK